MILKLCNQNHNNLRNRSTWLAMLLKDKRALALVRIAGDVPQSSSNVPRQIKLRVGTKLLPLTYRLAETIRLRADSEDPDVLEAEVYRTFREMLASLSDTPTSVTLQPVTDKLRFYLCKATAELRYSTSYPESMNDLLNYLKSLLPNQLR